MTVAREAAWPKQQACHACRRRKGHPALLQVGEQSCPHPFLLPADHAEGSTAKLALQQPKAASNFITTTCRACRGRPSHAAYVLSLTARCHAMRTALEQPCGAVV